MRRYHAPKPDRTTDLDRRSTENLNHQRRHDVTIVPADDEEHRNLLQKEYKHLMTHTAMQVPLGKNGDIFMENCRNGYLDHIHAQGRNNGLWLTHSECAYLLALIVNQQLAYPIPSKLWAQFQTIIAKKRPEDANFTPVTESALSPGRDY